MAAPSSWNWKYILIGVVVLIALWLLMSYNGLVRAKEGVDASWAQVETQYQRRFDLIPNLVSTVKGAAKFEQDTFIQVTQARSQWQAAGTRDQQIAAAQSLDSGLSKLIATFENYPQLQATQAFRDLMTSLEGTENRIATARRDYNTVVQSYNVMVKTFPRNVIAGMFGFAPQAFFQNTPGSENAPTVNF